MADILQITLPNAFSNMFGILIQLPLGLVSGDSIDNELHWFM